MFVLSFIRIKVISVTYGKINSIISYTTIHLLLLCAWAMKRGLQLLAVVTHVLFCYKFCFSN